VLRTAVIGASGYSGQELLRYLARHPVFELTLVTSRQQAGERLNQQISGLPPKVGSLKFIDLGADAKELPDQADIFFLAVPHGTAAPYAVALRKAGKVVVDLSADFRTTDPAVYKEFYDHEHPAPQLLKEAVYGLPELHREELKKAKLIAAPGCFPTSIILPLAPFLRGKAIDPAHVTVTSLSGVSGAGRKLELRLLFGEVSENMYPYGVPKHRHLGEIEQELSLAAGKPVTITFVPHLVPIHRGMVTTTVAPLTDTTMTDAIAHDLLKEAYGDEPFVELLPAGVLPQARDVAHSNRIQMTARVDARAGRLLIFSSIDNLGKGNASQAIQAANLACGLDEATGLN
jgi:N-acetyl-gamma-glutamyl-phosphate reductase